MCASYVHTQTHTRVGVMPYGFVCNMYTRERVKQNLFPPAIFLRNFRSPIRRAHNTLLNQNETTKKSSNLKKSSILKESPRAQKQLRLKLRQIQVCLQGVLFNQINEGAFGVRTLRQNQLPNTRQY